MLCHRTLLALGMLLALGLKAEEPIVYLEPKIAFTSSPSRELTGSSKNNLVVSNTNLSYELAIQKAVKTFVAEQDDIDPTTKSAMFKVLASEGTSLDARLAAAKVLNQVKFRNQKRYASLVEREYENILTSNGNLINFSSRIEFIGKTEEKLLFGFGGRSITTTERVLIPVFEERIKGLTLKNNLLNGFPLVQLIKTDVHEIKEGIAIDPIQYKIASKVDPTLGSTLNETPIHGYILEGQKLKNDRLLFSFPENLSCGFYIIRIQNDAYLIFVAPQAETNQTILLPERPFLSSLMSKSDEVSINTGEGNFKPHKDEVAKKLRSLPKCVGLIDYTFNKLGQILEVNFRNPANDGPPIIQLVTERDAIESCKQTILSATVVGPFLDFTYGTTFRRVSSPATMLTEQYYIDGYLKGVFSRAFLSRPPQSLNSE